VRIAEKRKRGKKIDWTQESIEKGMDLKLNVEFIVVDVMALRSIKNVDIVWHVIERDTWRNPRQIALHVGLLKRISEMLIAINVNVKNLDQKVLPKIEGQKMQKVEKPLVLIAVEKKKKPILMRVIAEIVKFSKRKNFDLLELLSRNLKMPHEELQPIKSSKESLKDYLAKYAEQMNIYRLTMMTMTSRWILDGYAESIIESIIKWKSVPRRNIKVILTN